MQMHTAGSLDNGKMVWALAKTNDSFELFKGDVTENYFLFSNPHQFGKAIDIRMTPIRVVCNNTLTLSLNKESDAMLKVNHRKEFDSSEVKDTLGIAREKLEQYKTMAEFLGSKRYTSENIVQYFNTVFGSPAKEKVDGVFPTTSLNAKLGLENLQTQPGAKFGEGTFWQAFNTVTYLNDHVQGRSADGRLTSSWYGRNRKTKMKALNTALEMAEVA
jgi:phage/plasmid-like protein (TIGR03299 family)